MKPYPAYKDSGVEWIGEIPEHWDKIRMKFTDEVIMGQSPNSDDYNDTESGLPFLQGNADFTSLYPKPRIWCETASKQASKDDVLLSVRAPVGAVNMADREYGIGRGLCAIRSKDTSHKFLYYISVSINDELNSIATGSTYVAVTADEVRNVYIPLLSSTEQQAIADYLDKKTALIDELIGKKRRQIELLTEQRQAVINQAVTKGLDPNVEMKDSGIEWLGKIPKHWEVKPIKYSAITNRESLPKTTAPNYSFRYVDIGNVNQGGIVNPPEELIYSDSPSRARRIVHKGDTIISTVRTYLKAIAFIDTDENDLIVSTGFAVLTPQKGLEPKFLYFLVSCEKIIDTIMALSLGISYPAINFPDLTSIPLWFPPSLDEQIEIIEFIENEKNKINDTLSKAERQIQLLQEYRTALISEAVTGKIDVREAV